MRHPRPQTRAPAGDSGTPLSTPLKRVRDLPEGIPSPRQVLGYRRREHYVLQRWDNAEKRLLSQRIDSDLLLALTRAREIDERIDASPAASTASWLNSIWRK
ncbi:MAG: hypothetical protein RIC55_34370 [Pirellulaceae bacterium]